jgi:hypothetical protein
MIDIYEKYEVPNGLLGINRKINMKLSSYLNEKKKRQFFAISLELYLILVQMLFNGLYYIGNKYEIPNGLLGMKRDINIKLSSYLVNYKKRQFFGISSEYFLWKDHFLFKNWNKFPFIEVRYGKIDKYLPNLLIGDSLHNIMIIKQRLFLNSGKYILKIIPTVLKRIHITIVDKYSIKRFFQMNLRNHLINTTIIEIIFNNDGEIESHVGILKRDELVKIEVDTNNQLLQCFINNKIIKCEYDLIRPLEFEITLEKNDMLKIESFQHFKK